MGVIAGVNYIHTYSPVIVHGDLKPVSSLKLPQFNLSCNLAPKGNILIDDQLNARLCDFGLARILAEAGTSGFTTTSEHTGTERYLSYELVLSDEMCATTTASDVYALACIGLDVSQYRSLFRHYAKLALSLSSCNLRTPTGRITFVDISFRTFARNCHLLVDPAHFWSH
jgi:serine/threonine protein kinase